MQVTPSPSPPQQRKSFWLDWRIRAAVSMALLLHLSAVVLPPLSLEGSPLASRGWYGLRAYIEAADINHGYRFFAPQPGPSHLIRYEMEMPDGQRQEGVFPDKEHSQPRLLYHRHCMLTEFLSVLHEGAVREDELERQRLADLAPQPYYPPAAESTAEVTVAPLPTEREMLTAFCRSYAQHLLADFGGRRVTIHLVRHLIPFPEDFRAGQTLDDPRLYSELFQETFEAETIAETVAPPPVAALVPIRGRAGGRR